MKLFELQRNTYFYFRGDRYLLHRIDGMYSICSDDEGNIHHIAAFAPVTLTEESNDDTN